MRLHFISQFIHGHVCVKDNHEVSPILAPFCNDFGSGSYGGFYKGCHLLECDAIWCVGGVRMFQVNVLPPPQNVF